MTKNWLKISSKWNSEFTSRPWGRKKPLKQKSMIQMYKIKRIREVNRVKAYFLLIVSSGAGLHRVGSLLGDALQEPEPGSIEKRLFRMDAGALSGPP
jgi:hypothetical protein